MYMYGYASVESYGWPGGMHGSFNWQDDLQPNIVKLPTACPQDRLRISDPTGIAVVRLVEADASIKGVAPSYNYRLLKPNTFVVGDTAVVVELSARDYAMPGLATLEVSDRSGNTKYVTVTYQPTLATTSTNEIGFVGKVGQDICMTVDVTNPSQTDWTDVQVRLQRKLPGFRIVEQPTFDLPAQSSRTLTVCYTPSDEAERVDSLAVVYNCTPVYVTLRANDVLPRIAATNADFGVVDSGSVTCTDVVLSNPSSVEVQVTGFTSSMQRFYLESPSTLPLTIAPGAITTLRVCHRALQVGSFTEVLKWVTNSSASDDKDTSVVTIEVRPRSSVHQDVATGNIAFWPNPARDVVHVRIPTTSMVDAEIVNVLGATLMRYSLSGSNDHELSIASLSPGNYQLKLRLGGEWIMIPFVKY